MRIEFFEDPLRGARSRDEIRFNELGAYVYDDGQRIAVGFDITPFRERPSLEVRVTNESGEEAASLTVIEAMHPNFNLTLHLRDQNPSGKYEIEAKLFYPDEAGSRLIVDTASKVIDLTKIGEQ